jgi:DNA-binding NarL/FixJ family response regulator
MAVAEGRPDEAATRVLIVDDHALFRRGLRMVLESEVDVVVVGEAADGETAVAMAPGLAPDVVLMDVRMPGMGGIEATRRLLTVVPSARVLILTVSDAEEDLYEAVKAGAIAYLLKEIPVEDVVDAVRAVRTGQSIISPPMATKLLSEFTSLARRAAEPQHPPRPRLTGRELEVLRLVADGLTNREVAEACPSRRTP